jgi:peptidoglycan hydrolase-like protein with peptidoglycan-binding domain
MPKGGGRKTAPSSLLPMRITSLTVFLSLLLTMVSLVAAATKRKTPAKKAASKSAPKSASSKKRVVRRRRPRTTWRNRQLQPTKERYKEIQQALYDKGYLKSEPTGIWGDESVDAMTRFQTAQNLPATGKITAASLIGLGLGAKSAGAPEAPPLPGAPEAKAAAAASQSASQPALQSASQP